MTITGNGFGVLGASLWDLGPLTDMVHLELNDGAAVLYGLNGAGKTRVLRAVADCTSGRLSATTARADLHIQVSSVVQPPDGQFVAELSKYLSKALARERGDMYSSYNFTDYEILYEEYRESSDDALTIRDKLDKLIDLYAAKRDLDESAIEILYTAAAYGRFTLQAGRDGRRALWMSAASSDSDLLAASIDSVVTELAASQVPAQSESNSGPSVFKHPIVDLLTATVYATQFSANRVGLPNEVVRSFPAWLNFPFLKLGDDFTAEPVTPISSLDEDESVNDRTLRTITRPNARKRNETIVEEIRNGQLEASTLVVAERLRIEGECNYHLSEVLLDPPLLRFNLRTADELLLGYRPQWEFAGDKSANEWFSIENLSSAQLRWARFSIALALAERGEAPVLFICDEPERGLHRLAELKVSTGLTSLSDNTSTGVLAATHSALLLNNTATNKILTYRDLNGATKIRPLTYSLVDPVDAELAGEQLGLSFADLQHLMKVAVVVEGLHDELVFRNLLRRQLDTSSANLFPIRGAGRATSLAEARLLFSATDAKILVVVDGLVHLKVDEIWKEVVQYATAGDDTAVTRAIGRLVDLKIDEAKFLAELATAAVSTRTIARINIFGLERPDVICYLPEALILNDRERTWSELIEMWKAAADPAVGPRNIKGFLKAKLRLLPENSEALDSKVAQAALDAANTSAILDPEIIRLGERVLELSEG